MNLLKTGITCLLVSLCATSTSAQLTPSIKDGLGKKPRIFHDLPQRMLVDKPAFIHLLDKEVGEDIQMQIASDFMFIGKVVSKSDASEQRSKTVVVKSSNRPGVALTITGVRKSDGTYRYNGRILSLKHSDAYVMVANGDGFALEKKDLADLVNE